MDNAGSDREDDGDVCASTNYDTFVYKFSDNYEENGAPAKEDTDINYQTINVFPTPNEVLTDTRNYVRANIVEGSYESVEHYLDTHFRLLREDFLAPLRASICAYKTNLRNNMYKKIPEIRVYSETVFVQSQDKERDIRRLSYPIVRPGFCYQRNANDIFMCGSLLCFSSDNFDTIFFGTVVKVYKTPIGCINVRLLEEVPFLYDETYTMLECTNYFDPYCLVLRALQNFDTTNNFPMKKYLVDAKNEWEPPQYLTVDTKYVSDNRSFEVLNFSTWPTAEEFNLNEMQYQALKRALTSSFVIIQGPPGTGKTYLGLRIAQILIENRSSSRPILVVALTNHALDQFLEELLKYTEEIIRIGHQSKNNNVRKFIFRRTSSRCEYNTIWQTLLSKQNLMEELQCVLSYGGIYDIKRFAVCNPELLNSSILKLTNEEIVSWLMGDFITEQLREERWETTKEMSNNNDHCSTILDINRKYEANHILKMSQLENTAKELENELKFKDLIALETIFEDWDSKEEQYKQILDNIDYLEWRLQHAKLHSAQTSIQTSNFRTLPYNDRWILYFHWLDCYVEHLKNVLKEYNMNLHEEWDELEEIKQKLDSDSISEALVVGMTTSGAVRHRHLLENLKCQIVIVEEAAAVLESHIITCLTRHCQHLILIGDHQQLRPNTADHQIGTRYQLGISLFERMVRNGICYSTLSVQHRMRPEISQLIKPAIYPDLTNHISVCNFPHIGGFKHDVFFVNHSQPEMAHGLSRSNPHEAQYLIVLARHLILQGVHPNEITILTTYKGQMHEIKRLLHDNVCKPLTEVRVTVVDNFQGEENQIILLSLVRSNDNACIGFLAVDNRVCVALSRAKKGFYMIGNMENLSSSSGTWMKIREILEKNGQIGRGLELTCQIHPDNVTVVVEPTDFMKVIDGGCHLFCNANLICGHKCRFQCHVIDQQHLCYLCIEPCTRSCPRHHPCTKKCFEICEDCQVQVITQLPCGHKKSFPCYIKIEEFVCDKKVAVLLTCGHTVLKPCFQNDDVFCPVMVKAVHPTCGHIIEKQCYESVEHMLCLTRVSINLPCGHKMAGECWVTNEYSFCDVPCSEMLPCSHRCHRRCHPASHYLHAIEKCIQTCMRLKPNCKNNHKCTRLCSEPCEECFIEVKIHLPCGHSKMVPCNKSDCLSMYLCDDHGKTYCKKTKPCGHVCFDLCHLVCDPKCFYKVYKTYSSCGHQIRTYCYEEIEAKLCPTCKQEYEEE